MSDEQERELERLAVTGDEEAAKALARAKRRKQRPPPPDPNCPHHPEWAQNRRRRVFRLPSGQVEQRWWTCPACKLVKIETAWAGSVRLGGQSRKLDRTVDVERLHSRVERDLILRERHRCLMQLVSDTVQDEWDRENSLDAGMRDLGRRISERVEQDMINAIFPQIPRDE